MELSKRLRAVATMVTPGLVLADVGTDHAYIPIFLVEQGIIPAAVALDVNEGPLLRAKENISEHGLGGRIRTRISDGVEALNPSEAESVVIAGMGGGLVIRILKNGMDTIRQMRECILQPQSEIKKVRAFLLEEGFSFTDENMVEEDGKYYPVMKVLPPADQNMELYEARSRMEWNETELTYGRILLENRNPVLLRYLQKEIRIREKILESMDDKDSERISIRKNELVKEKEYAEKGLKYYVLQ